MLVVTGVVHVWHVLLLSFVTGCAQAFGGPANQSLLPSLVPKRDLPNAIALNSIQFNLSRLIGPVLAGVILAACGTAVCFGVNALSYLAVVAALRRDFSATRRPARPALARARTARGLRPRPRRPTLGR